MYHGTCVPQIRGGTENFPIIPIHAQQAILRIWQRPMQNIVLNLILNSYRTCDKKSLSNEYHDRICACQGTVKVNKVITQTTNNSPIGASLLVI